MGKFDFSKVGGAKISEKGEPLTPNVRNAGVDAAGKPVQEKYAANYELEVSRCIALTSRNKKNLFIAECLVTASDNPAHPVGCKRSWVQDIDIDAGPGALKAFVVACLGIDHRSAEGKEAIKELEDKFEAIMTEALEDESEPACKNGFKGACVKVEVKEIDTKPKTKGGEAGKFNLHTFSPVAKKAA